MARMGRATLLCAGLLSAARLHAQAPVELRVPHGAPVTMDARLTPSEWENAAVVELSDGGELRLQHDGRFLYLGLRAGAPGFPSVCVIGSDVVRVLHASAALGRAEYVRDGDAWAVRAPFAYGLRTRDTTEAARAERAAYLRDNGWLATTMYMGDRTQKEMQIPLAYLRDDDVRVAVAYMRDAPNTRGPSAVWPGRLADGCVDATLVKGFAVKRARFAPERWARLTIVP